MEAWFSVSAILLRYFLGTSPEGGFIKLGSLTMWFTSFRIICALLLTNLRIYDIQSKVRNSKALPISCSVEYKSINEKWKCFCTKQKRGNDLSNLEISLSSRFALNFVRLKRNVNLKKNEEVLAWRFFPGYNYIFVKTDLKPVFPCLQCHYNNIMRLFMETL